jgi:sulfite reductase (ferredoxin)
MPPQTSGQGQWALGEREPLNPAEQFKQDDDGLAVRERIVNQYAAGGFDSIDPSDLRGRFRWMGLYTQRRPGISGGQTATLAPEELDDRYFMMRIRSDGGRLSAAQLRAVADISTQYARGTADVTDRENIQLHWVRIEDVPAIWEKLASVGLSTTEACGDTPRGMLGCPLAGLAEDELIDGTPMLQEIVAKYVGNPEFSNLPRKYKTVVSGCAEHCTVHELNDVAFVGVVGPDGAPGFDLWVGGGLSTNPQLATRIGVFVPPERVSEVWAGVTGVFRDYGYRKSRNRARLKFLVKDWGPEKFREVLETEYLSAPLPDGPAPTPATTDSRDHVGVTRLKDGTVAIGVAPRAGRSSGEQLTALADIVERYGVRGVAFTTLQKMVLVGAPADVVDEVTTALDALDLPSKPSPFRRATMACTGIEYCKLAIVETKARADALATELESRMPDWTEPIGINLNGCPNSCARFQVADIGFKGSLVPDGNGDTVEGYQVHLGGHLGIESRLGRKLRGHKLTSRELPDYIERLLKTYESERRDGENFSSWVARADEGSLL